MSTNCGDFLRIVGYIVFVKHVVEFRDQLVVHAVLGCTVVHEEVSQVVAGLVHALAVGNCRKQNPPVNRDDGAGAAATLTLLFLGRGAPSW